MLVHPDMTIHFPASREADLVERMKKRLRAPWQRLEVPTETLFENNYLFFHRDEVGSDPPCKLCIFRQEPGKFSVVNIVPHTTGWYRLSVEQYVGILREFDTLIAEPAAEEVGGMTSIETHEQGLADYFAASSIRLLRLFCKTSNVSTLGEHPSDQFKWRAFLLDVYRSQARVRPDTFGALLRAEGWWPEEGIARLTLEYELALELLAMADGRETYFLEGKMS